MQTPSTSSVSAIRTDFSGKHILIADDEPINMMIAGKMLVAKNAAISKAANGHELLQQLSLGLRPDLILLDINMPGLDGYMTVRRIKEHYPELIVFAFTAFFIDDEMEQELIEKGFSGVMQKSYKPEIFYDKISLAFDTISRFS
ncbi:response regulator [Panacibacter sp. DH6]|uniref:Response regulator n=1 Tax=Panacibacter microcysteis TaxID=2793269 RepID=A0A931E8R8_9BACT|nr:response regulator [Panacibacter microcysteis]MBG9376299.1 response regulator [Panacibacter microcysteis]